MGEFSGSPSKLRIVFQVRITFANFKIYISPHATSNAVGDLYHSLMSLGPPFLIQGPKGSFNLYFIWNDVGGAFCNDSSE